MTAQPGFYQPPGSTTAIIDPAGTYTNTSGATAPISADPGYYVPLAGSSAETPDSAGSYTDTQGASTAVLAPPGSYVGTTGATAATLDQPGTYTSTSGATTARLADPGYYVPLAGSSAETPDDAGSYTDTYGASTALLAPPGSYVGTTGATAATLDQPGTYTNSSGATTARLADPGYYVPLAGNSAETPDPLGTYTNTAGASVALDAPPGSYVGTTGATAATIDQPGTYTDAAGASAAILAPAGSYVGTTGATAATLDQPGSYTDTAGATAPTLAPPGYYVDTAGATAPIAAPPGYYDPGYGNTEPIPVPCYCPGTLIRTNRGQTRVENLKIGDRVKTVSGEVRPIKWIGRRSYAGRFTEGQKHVLPVCIKAGALDENVPRRDLWMSPQHAMYLEGVLIEAKDLVNGVSIVQAERVEIVEYVHIELDSHDIIIAEGAPSESFIDDDSLGLFQNANEYEALYPDAETPKARYYAPRLQAGDEVEAARQRISLRAGLAYTPPEPQIDATRASLPQALVVDSVFPQIGHDGGANAVLDHVRSLQTAGFAVSFLALRDSQGDTSALASLGAVPLRMAHGMGVEQVFRRHRFDLVYLHRLENAAAAIKIARRHGAAQIVYSVADLHHLRLKGQSTIERDPGRARQLSQQALQVGVLELSLAAAADIVITHSTAEAEWLRRAPGTRGTGKVHVVPWSIPVQPVRRPFRRRSGIAFIGSFRHAPNIDAARWLVETVMPLVQRSTPDITCFLAGSDMPDEVSGLRRAGVEVLGRVDELHDVFERVRLTVAPLRFGAGVKDKVVRSLGAGLPCVGTPLAFDGLPPLPDDLLRHCLCHSAGDLAAAIIAMHRDEAANARCAELGLDYIGANFDATCIDALIDAVAKPARDRHRARRLSLSPHQAREATDPAKCPNPQFSRSAEPAAMDLPIAKASRRC